MTIEPKYSVVWKQAPVNLDLPAGQIHIWRANLEGLQSHSILKILSTEELERGQRLVQEKHRQRFYLSKAFLRRLLGKYLQIEPSRLQYREGDFGKPYLKDEKPALQFNMTHSADLVLFAFSRELELGIDTEYLDRSLQAEALSLHCYNPEESQYILSLPSSLRVPAFYDFWTRKEAYLKAFGLGISHLKQAIAKTTVETSIIGFDPLPNYTAALAWRNQKPTNKPILIFFDMTNTNK
jgi:4'-phosphopantetheinyl transferase